MQHLLIIAQVELASQSCNGAVSCNLVMFELLRGVAEMPSGASRPSSVALDRRPSFRRLEAIIGTNPKSLAGRANDRVNMPGRVALAYSSRG